MKFFIAFACLLAVAVANEDAQVLRNEAEVNVDSFKYALALDNTVDINQQGQLNGDVWSVNGESKWTSPEGTPVEISYVADENGYQPKSDLLPTPPPVPAAILKAIEYIQSHPSKEE